MGHILKDGKPTIESDGHIVASGRPLHICSKFFLHTLVVVGDGSIIRFWDLWWGTDLCVCNFQVFLESPLLKIVRSQLSLVITIRCLEISPFIAI